MPKVTTTLEKDTLPNPGFDPKNFDNEQCKVTFGQHFVDEDSLLMASHIYEELLEQNSSPELHERYAALKLKLNQGLSATRSLEILLKLNPSNTKIASQLNDIYVKYGLYEKQLQLLSSQTKGNSLEWNLQKAHALRMTGKKEKLHSSMAFIKHIPKIPRLAST